jgi:putative transcriptional regulator
LLDVERVVRRLASAKPCSSRAWVRNGCQRQQRSTFIVVYNILIALDQLLSDRMISCRLSTILGAKRLKVSDVCRATGIARATLDRYYNDRVKSFDRDVLGKLCQFLQVKPGDLLVEVEQGDLFGLPTAQDGEVS